VVLVLAVAVPLVQYESFLLLIGSVFVPLIGVQTADFFLLRSRLYVTEGLYRVGGQYWYTGGINWTAMGVWLVGFVLYLVIAGLPPLGFAGLAPWLGATLPSFLFGFLAYAAVGRIRSSREERSVGR
jgi:cytosine/uracil/thiamine/allantoin permease